jgi:hypothetical protein
VKVEKDAVALGFFEGPAHVIRYVNQTYLDLQPNAHLGMPVREAFTSTAHRAAQDAIDRVYETGSDEMVTYPLGRLWLMAVEANDVHARGVLSHYRRSAPLATRQRRPGLLREPA